MPSFTLKGVSGRYSYILCLQRNHRARRLDNEGILLSDEEDNAQQPSIAAAVPRVLCSNKKAPFPSPKAIGVFRCVPKRDHPGLSINDYIRFPTIPRFFFCLVEFTNIGTSVRVFRVNYKNYIYSLEPTEFELFPKVPPIEENRNKDGLPESPMTQSLKSRLEEIKVSDPDATGENRVLIYRV
ncbi:hypothetical protein TSMEX_009712 [Taenia solium]|eukprot:TsM_000913600 transcript=TsM_000913600 gene=TsM_000913600